ncbi:MAG: prephenate dehydrogenase/arogenate dehydrogenase family protein [Methanoregulaceae archaeon]|nr:prephenate dehydrogenase/arogenate dehydrogenase family protein [Methanoregulaceae archaeon]
MKVGIIGGTGKMGTFFSHVFERGGYLVACSGRSTDLTNRALAEESDIVVVSVPIRSTVSVIDEIAPLLSGDQLICDLTSLKIAPVQAMLRSRAQVVGLHPMFGPSVGSLAGQTIIATPARVEKPALDRMLGLFRAEGARVTITTPDHHDRIMAVVQGLTHFVTLSMAEAMRQTGITPADTESFMSPVYQIEMGLIGRLLTQDPALYGAILAENPYVPAVLDACRDAVARIRASLHDPSGEEFTRIFMENAENFGEYSAKAQEETDLIIERMVRG